MDAPIAPDLDEIIGGSDEENDVNTELLTPAELLQRLLKLWQNEKVAPQLLSAHPDLLDVVQQETNRMEIQAKSWPSGDLRAQIQRMQVERIRFLLTDYMRIRIAKIEQFSGHILAEERARPQGEAPHLTAEEFLFAKAYTGSIKEYLRNVIISRLPNNMQTVNDEDLSLHPNENGYVFCRALSRVGHITIPDYTKTDSQPRTASMSLEPGEQHLLPYSSIRSYVEAGDILLI